MMDECPAPIALAYMISAEFFLTYKDYSEVERYVGIAHHIVQKVIDNNAESLLAPWPWQEAQQQFALAADTREVIFA